MNKNKLEKKLLKLMLKMRKYCIENDINKISCLGTKDQILIWSDESKIINDYKIDIYKKL